MTTNELAAEVADFMAYSIEDGLEELTYARDAVKLLDAVLNDRITTFYYDEPFVEFLRDQFEEHHEVWTFIELES